MYEYITGTLTQLTPTAATIEASGVGYFINISLQTFKTIDGATKAKLWVHTYVLQNEAPQFYGFATTSERELFRLLISISGVGANTARVMLSTYSTDELANMIAVGNTAAIQKTKGIGAKTAERVVLELKSKVLSVMSVSPLSMENGDTPNELMENLHEAISALVVLGFNKVNVEKVTRKIFKDEPTISAENLIREALSQL